MCARWGPSQHQNAAHYRRFEVCRVSRPYLDRLWCIEQRNLNFIRQIALFGRWLVIQQIKLKFGCWKPGWDGCVFKTYPLDKLSGLRRGGGRCECRCGDIVGGRRRWDPTCDQMHDTGLEPMASVVGGRRLDDWAIPILRELHWLPIELHI